MGERTPSYGKKKTKINIEILYEIEFKFLCFHSIEQPVKPSSSVYFDQPNNGIVVQNNENIIDTKIAIATLLFVIFLIFDGLLST